MINCTSSSQVVVVTDKGIVRLFLDEYLNITVDTLVASSITLARNVDNHTLSNTGRNSDFYHFLTFDALRLPKAYTPCE